MPLPPLVKQIVDMKFTRYCKEKIPPELLDSVQLEYRVRGNNVTLLEKRPHVVNPHEWVEIPLAQFRYDFEDNEWTLYYADRNGKWHEYYDFEPSSNLENLLSEVDEDPTGIFWG